MGDNNDSGLPRQSTAASSRKQLKQPDHHPLFGARIDSSSNQNECNQEPPRPDVVAPAPSAIMSIDDEEPQEENHQTISQTEPSPLDTVAPAPIANMSIHDEQPQESHPQENNNLLVGPESYPWNGSWEEAKKTRTLYPARNPWTVAADLFVLENVSKYYATAARTGRGMRAERRQVGIQMVADWKTQGFDFEPTLHGLLFRYKTLEICLREEARDGGQDTEDTN